MLRLYHDPDVDFHRSFADPPAVPTEFFSCPVSNLRTVEAHVQQGGACLVKISPRKSLVCICRDFLCTPGGGVDNVLVQKCVRDREAQALGWLPDPKLQRREVAVTDEWYIVPVKSLQGTLGLYTEPQYRFLCLDSSEPNVYYYSRFYSPEQKRAFNYRQVTQAVKPCFTPNVTDIVSTGAADLDACLNHHKRRLVFSLRRDGDMRTVSTLVPVGVLTYIKEVLEDATTPLLPTRVTSGSLIYKHFTQVQCRGSGSRLHAVCGGYLIVSGTHVWDQQAEVCVSRDD